MRKTKDEGAPPTRRKRKNEGPTRVFCVQLPDAMRERLDRLARERGTSTGAQVVEAISARLDAYDGGPSA